ncbi:hypothetical protein BRADI_1g16522v3 [Brachypodium distachyon]|uniref:Uncharacterized protein n=1 Tax=Brachypodium distachyon TaxID=15368 RepID=A0A0Q3JR08_BRADI|nr:hypothetical protein BRADI_1g16522v3 [Brachypodium distachyon]
MSCVVPNIDLLQSGGRRGPWKAWRRRWQSHSSSSQIPRRLVLRVRWMGALNFILDGGLLVQSLFLLKPNITSYIVKRSIRVLPTQTRPSVRLRSSSLIQILPQKSKVHMSFTKSPIG